MCVHSGAGTRAGDGVVIHNGEGLDVRPSSPSVATTSGKDAEFVGLIKQEGRVMKVTITRPHC